MKNDFIEKLYANLEMYADKNVPIVLLGDVNINVDMSDDNTVQNYTDMLASVGWHNLIKGAGGGSEPQIFFIAFSVRTKAYLPHIFYRMRFWCIEVS